MFQNLVVKKEEIEFSFVGIKYNPIHKQYELFLPHGFKNFPENDFEVKKNFFFKMYKVFKKFVAEHSESINNYKIKDRDGVIKGQEGFEIKLGNNKSTVLYSKLTLLDSILHNYDELKIYSFLNKNVTSQNIDYSKLDKYLHKAVFLENHVPFIDEMITLRKKREHTHTKLIEIYSFIFNEIKTELEEEEINPIVRKLAKNFKDENLMPNSSLFDNKTYENTINTLKSILSEIDRKIAYKDDDYWHFFSAIETFLYGAETNIEQKGEYFGINNFSFVWESICQNYMLKSKDFENLILFADISEDSDVYEKILDKYGDIENKIFIKKGFNNPFSFQLNNTTKQRFLKPDLMKVVYYSANIEKLENDSGLILDNDFVNIKFTYINSKKLNAKIKLINKKRKKDLVKLIRVLKKSSRSDNRTEIFIKNIHIDVIIKNLNLMMSDKYEIIDYKYHPLNDFIKINDKIIDDIKKQLVYELAFENSLELSNKNYINYQIKSQFVIPYYFDENYFKSKDDMIGESHMNTNKLLKNNKIKLFKANFMYIIEKYLEK